MLPDATVLLFGLTGCAGLRDLLINAGAEAAADWNVAGVAAGLPALIPQLFFSSPFSSSV